MVWKHIIGVILTSQINNIIPIHAKIAQILLEHGEKHRAVQESTTLYTTGLSILIESFPRHLDAEITKIHGSPGTA